MNHSISAQSSSAPLRLASFDSVKLLLAVMVIGAHTYVLVGTYPQISFYLTNGLFRIAVPLFFIMNGYFLPDPSKGMKYRAYILRIMLMYAIWMALYFPVYIETAIDNGVIYLIKDLVFGYWHLWYIAALIQASILMSVFVKVDVLKRLVIVLMLYAIGAGMQYYAYFEYTGTIPYCIYRNAVFYALPFIVIGHAYKGIESYIIRYRMPIMALSIILLVEEIYMASLHSRGDRGFDVYVSLIFLCPCIFSYIQSISPYHVSFPIGKLSTALYLLHPFFILLALARGFSDGSSLFFFTVIASLVAAIPTISLSRKIPSLL